MHVMTKSVAKEGWWQTSGGRTELWDLLAFAIHVPSVTRLSTQVLPAELLY